MSVLDFFGEEDTRITQLVYDISGSNANDQLGHSISIGLSGEIIAVGAPTSSQGGTERGLVRVYQKLTDLSGVSSWNQMGADLAGTSDNLQFGHSVDLNGDGTILAVGTKDPSNTLLVYNYDGSSWNQYGDTIYLDNNTAFETSISHITKGKLNYDGTKLVALNHNLGYTHSSESTTVTTSHTSPYVTHGCTCNFDFRTNSSTGITDDIGNVDCDYEGTSSTTTDGMECDNGAGTSFSSTPTKYARIQSGLTYGGQGSYEFYLKFDAGVDWCTLFEIRNSSSERVCLQARNPGPAFYMFNPGGAETSVSTNTRASGSYHHFVFTVSSSKQYSIYIDGVLEGTSSFGTLTSAITTGSNGTNFIGCERLIRGGFDGYYKFWRYYHGKVLSQSEVTDLYNDRDDTSTATGRDGTETEGTNTVTTTVETTVNVQNDSVESYEYSSSTWNQVGNTIQSTSVNDISGGDIAINDAGNTIAIGYPEGKSAIPSTYTYTVTAGSVFEFYGEEYTSDTANPALSFKRGSTYVLNINTTSLHPFWIQTSDNSGIYDSANVYSSGITNNGIYDGTITFVVPMDAPDTLYYRCGQHGNMGNSISITSALSKTGIAKVFQYNTTDISWNQVGTNIDGSGENDFFGSSIAMDSSGEFVAVGGPFAGDASAGHVKVYQNVNNTWNQAGNQIQGSSDNDQFGSAVDMNSDGKVIVVGAKNADSGKGSATVYQYKNTVTGYNTSDLSWNRIGAGITGDSAGDFVGTSVGIIGEGTEFSVGAPGKQVDTNDNAGTVESYTFDYEKISDTEPRFTQILTPILGTAANDRMGEAVVTSLTGDVIAISAPNNSGGGVERGLVRVYQKGDSSWTQLGSDLTGTNDNDQFGYSLDINADGTILSVGTKDVSNNALYVYQYDGSTWNQYGNTIKVFKDSDISFNESSFIQGSKVKLNKEGNKLITSNKYNISNSYSTTSSLSISNYLTTIDCTANFDFRTNSSTGITDDIGNVDCDYIGTSSTTTDGMEIDNGNPGNFQTVPTKYARIQGGLTYGGQGSYEFYMKFDSGVEWATIFDIPNICLQYPSAKRWYMFMAHSGAANLYVSTETKGTGQYHHFVITVSSSKEYNMYIDGEHQTTVSFTIMDDEKTTGNNGTNFIGAEMQVRGGFDGYMKYFRYYHGKILSQSEVTDLYNKKDDTTITENTLSTFNYDEELVQAYEYSSPSWNQIGNTIESSSLHDISGGDIAINHSGDLIAVGYPNANGSGEQSGFTKIFKYDANDASWNQVSDNINGSTTGDLAGTSLTFDMCDNYLGISSPFAGNNSEGSVNVYKITDSSWEHFGNIDGLTANEQLGSIAMTPSAEIIAVGSKTAFDGAGVVRIYMKNSNLSNGFEKLSGDISGSTYTYNPTVQTETGSSIFLSEDGQIISVGEPGYNVGTDDNTGRVRVFNVTLPQPPVPDEDDWLYNYSTSNTLKSIYMKGMLEMDNATLRTRNEDNNLIGSVDASFNGGNVYLGETVKIGTETVKTDIALDVSGNTNISGNLKIIGDLSAISQINVDHVDISGDLIVSGDTTNISLSSQDVNYNSELIITDASLNINKSKLSDNVGKVPITVENVLSDGNYSQIGENIWGPQDEGSYTTTNWTTYTAPIAINDEGDIIVIGYNNYDSLNLQSNGMVRVYRYMSITENEYNNGNTNAYSSTSAFNGSSGVPIIANNSVAWSADAKFWVQLGDDIYSLDGSTPSNSSDNLGRTTSINGAGDIIAISSQQNDVNGSNNGRVGVFKYSTPGKLGGDWEIMGNIMGIQFGSQTSITMGENMQLDQSGKIISISCNDIVDTVNFPSSMKVPYDSNDYTDVAIYAVFQYRTVTESEFNAGNTTSFDPNDGTPIIQAHGGSWNENTEYWVQLGNYMYIPYNSSGDGTISISSDGSRVMISSSQYRPDDYTNSSEYHGATEVFEYSSPGEINGTWNRLGARMFGVPTYGYGYRYTASMTQDGNVVALSHNDADGISYATNNYGVVRAMEYRLVTQTEWDNAKKAATEDITTTIGVPLIYPDGDTVLNTTKKYWIQLGADLFNSTTSGGGKYCRISNTHEGYMLSQFGSAGDYGRVYKYATISESEYNSRSTSHTQSTYTTPPTNAIFTNGESWASDKKFWVQVGSHFSAPITSGDDWFIYYFTRDGTKFIAGAYDAQLNSTYGNGAVQVYKFDTETITLGYNYQSIVTDVSASSPITINAVYPPTTMTSINTDTINQFSGTISGQTYGNGNYTITCDVDNTYTVTTPERSWPPTAARDNFSAYENGTTSYIATASGQSYGNGLYRIYSSNDSTWGLDHFYFSNPTGSGTERFYVARDVGYDANLYFWFPEKIKLKSVTTRYNNTCGTWWIYAQNGYLNSETDYDGGSSIGTIYYSTSVPLTTSSTGETTLTINSSIEASVYRIRMRRTGTASYVQNSYFEFVAEGYDTTTEAPLSCLYNNAIADYNTNLHIESTNTPTLTFTFPDSFILNNIYTVNNNCAQTWIVKAFDGDTELEELYNGTVTITSGELNLSITNTNQISANKYTLQLSNPASGIEFYQNAEFKFTGEATVQPAATFGEDVSLNPALSVPGNILIVDSSNSEYNYGSYTIHTDKDYANYFAVGKSASDVFNIVNNNNAGVYMSSSANSFTGTSDERLKKNICDIEDKDLENLQQLRPVSYKWKKQTDDTEHYGFIAQEVEKYLPNLVDENTCPDGSTYKGVAVDDLIPYMIKYIQKLKKKIVEKEKEMET
jgi:hypothetical protein